MWLGPTPSPDQGHVRDRYGVAQCTTAAADEQVQYGAQERSSRRRRHRRVRSKIARRPAVATKHGRMRRLDSRFRITIRIRIRFRFRFRIGLCALCLHRYHRVRSQATIRMAAQLGRFRIKCGVALGTVPDRALLPNRYTNCNGHPRCTLLEVSSSTRLVRSCARQKSCSRLGRVMPKRKAQ